MGWGAGDPKIRLGAQQLVCFSQARRSQRVEHAFSQEGMFSQLHSCNANRQNNASGEPPHMHFKVCQERGRFRLDGAGWGLRLFDTLPDLLGAGGELDCGRHGNHKVVRLLQPPAGGATAGATADSAGATPSTWTRCAPTLTLPLTQPHPWPEPEP